MEPLIDPYNVLVLRRSNDLDLHGAGSQGSNLLLLPVDNAWVHGGPQAALAERSLRNVRVILCDGIEYSFMDAAGFQDKSLGASEPLTANSDDLGVGQLLALLQGGGGCSSARLLLEV